MQFIISTVSMSKTVPFEINQFRISTQFKCKYTAKLSKTFLFRAIQCSQTVLIQTMQFIISTVSMSKSVPFEINQFRISTQFKCKYTAKLSKTFLFRAIQCSQTVLIQTMQFIISTVSMSKSVPFEINQFSISTQFKCKYTAKLSKTFLFQAIQCSQTVLIQTIQFSISSLVLFFSEFFVLHMVSQKECCKQF